MNKSPDAFRTISEVADFLETPAHVLRFWESRFPQIRPVKRAGGRRYYRPADVALLTGIKRLLHDEGMTIRGVQKILREQGVRHVSGLSDDAPEIEDDDAIALADATRPAAPDQDLTPAEVESAQIIALRAAFPPPTGAMTPEPVAETSAPADDLPIDWQSDSAPETEALSDLSDAPPPVVTVPPAPVTSAPPIPVIADLFARPPEPPPQVAAPPEPAAPVEEAPMDVWADEADAVYEAPDGTAASKSASPAPSAPVLNIPRIGAPAPVLPPDGAQTPPLPPGPTLAQRLRARTPVDLDPQERVHLAQLRNQAVALRARLAGPARPIG